MNDSVPGGPSQGGLITPLSKVIARERVSNQAHKTTAAIGCTWRLKREKHPLSQI